MDLPEFFNSFPALDLPFPEDQVQSRAIASDKGLVVFFTFLRDFSLPTHSHEGQWGTVLEGEIELTIGDETRTYRAGDSYSIPAGVPHGARIKAGTKAMDVFEEPERYALKT